jgi:hypothetical protein
MAIIAVLASIGLPALRGIGKGSAINAATRQLLDDLALARLKAIGSRTTVYVVFVPTNLLTRLNAESNPQVRRQLTNLFTGQYTSYALLTRRTVGDQPGRETPQYVTEWRQLPEGVLIAPYKFHAGLTNLPNEYFRSFQAVDNGWMPFPTATNYLPGFRLPVVAFNPAGQLMTGRDEIIPLAEGSVFFSDVSGRLTAPDVEIRPPDNFTNNVIRVSWLTGRASVERLVPQ